MANQRVTAAGLGLACLLVAAAALPDLCPPSKAPLPAATDAAGEEELTPLCETVKQARTSGGLLTPVTCPTEGCRCHRQRPELRCVPFNTTVTQQRDGVETKTSVTVACVCAIPG